MKLFKMDGMLCSRAVEIVREHALPCGEATLIRFDLLGPFPFANQDEWMRLTEDGAIEERRLDEEWVLVAKPQVVY